jgi:peptidyl-prolyl cis-trans isomerase D
MSITEYETDVKKQLIIQKTLKLLPVEANDEELNILNTLINIADKIEYKVLDNTQITVDSSEELVKAFWETRAQNFMSEVSYDLKIIKQEKISKSYTDTEISEYYSENRTHFKDAEGKIIPLENAKEAVIAELDSKATKDMALRTYIAYKKGNLSPDIAIEELTLKASQNPYGDEVLQKISQLSPTSPYMKPVEVNSEYITVELVRVNPSKAKTFQEAKEEVTPLFIEQTKQEKLLKLAKDSAKSFTGTQTDFITSLDVSELPGIDPIDAGNFLQQLFMQNDKRGFITLTNGKIVLFNILEQKLLTKTNGKKDDTIVKLKSAMFEKGLIENLQNKYKTEIFIEGL